MVSIKVLGAYGTKGDNHETTCISLNQYNVIDAGNLLKGLADGCMELDTIWLTHSHLDHIKDIAFVLDYYFEQRKKSLKIAGLPATLQILQKHFLNELIWPDFSKIPLNGSGFMAVEYIPIETGKRYKIGNNEYIEAFLTNHTVPSCGYIVTKEENSIAITADTYMNSGICEIVNQRPDIKALIIECSFPSRMGNLAEQSKHLTPDLLSLELKKLKRNIPIYVNHLKPNCEQEIRNELETIDSVLTIKIVHDYDVIDF